MKAQLWSSDLAVSVLIFFSAFAIIMFTWNYVILQNTEQAEIREIETLALSISDQIIRIPGMPENWEPGNINALGLATGENVLNDSKIENLLDMSYQDTRMLLGLGSYNLYLQVSHLNNTIAQTLSGREISYGQPLSEERVAVPVGRYCMLNSKMVRLDIIIWKGF